MPDIGYSPEIQSDIASRRSWVVGRMMLVGAIVAGVAPAVVATPAEETAQAVQAAGPELTRLLRAMAALKLMFATGLLAAAYWRLAVLASTWRLASYAVAGAATASGPVLIWEMVARRSRGVAAAWRPLGRRPVAVERPGSG